MPVRKVKGGYRVKGVKTTHKTKAAAEKQHRAIKADQARRAKKK